MHGLTALFMYQAILQETKENGEEKKKPSLKRPNLIKSSSFCSRGFDLAYLHINFSLLLENPVYSVEHAGPFICPGQHFLQQMK